MSDPYLDALEQLDQMRDRAFKAEAAIARVREVCDRLMVPTSLGGYIEWVRVDDILRALEGDSDDE